MNHPCCQMAAETWFTPGSASLRRAPRQRRIRNRRATADTAYHAP
jgi:hypothetical protein